jgi:Ca-activated chloride channel family protein
MRLALRIAITGLLMALIWALVAPLVAARVENELTLSLVSHQLDLLAPRWLLLLSCLPLLWLLQSKTLVDLAPAQRAASLCLRLLLLATLVVALSRPAIPSRRDLLAVVFLVDISDSISDKQLDYAREVLRRAAAAKGRHHMRVVVFARDAALAVGSSGTTTSPAALVRAGKPAASRATNIQAAIQHAHGLFPPDRVPRLVLISDGNETAGDALAEIPRLRERAVRLSVIPVPPREQREVLVQSLRVPTEVHVGAPFELTSRVFATHREKIVLTLDKEGLLNALDPRQEVLLQPGRNTVKFKSLVVESGVVAYRLTVSGAQHDTWKHNNSARAIVPVLGRPRVLVIDRQPATAQPLRKALEAEEIAVELRGVVGLPRRSAELAQFDLLVLGDVPATDVSHSQMEAIEVYVRELGGGFLMLGGPDSFGAGGYYNTRIERLLPVQLAGQRREDQPSLALVLCIDRSGSMSGPKLELAKEAAKTTSELLGPDDLLGLVAFDSSAHEIVRLQRAAHRLKIASDIARLRSGGGTSIYPALRQAYGQLTLATAKVKHVILLSDGQSSYGSIARLVDQMVADKITVSAVGVGSGADRTLLQMVAERGNGRYYHTDEAANIPKIFTQETTHVARSALVEQPTRAHVVRRASVLKGIVMGRAPALGGYVSTKAKPLSEEILRTDGGEPLLIWWRVGLGKSAAFTSDAKARWGSGWLRWRGYRKFWAQLARELVRHPLQRKYDLRATVRRDRVRVWLDARDEGGQYVNGLATDVTLQDPTRPADTYHLELTQTAPGYYEGETPLPRHGAFLVRARHRIGERPAGESVTAISVPYPREYTHLVPNTKRLERLAELTAGSVSPTVEQLFDPDDQHIRYRREIRSWLLLFALALFPLDVALRRIRFRRRRRPTI